LRAILAIFAILGDFDLALAVTSCEFSSGKLPSMRNKLDKDMKEHAEEKRSMTAFEEHRDELEHYETMMGPNRGRLAVTLDLLTNALVLVGQHGVYCHSNWNPEQPVMDIRIVTQEISKAKELIQSVMESLRAEREAKRP
jgi:hypothetical protein